MEGKGWAVIALLIGVVIGANHKKIREFLEPALKKVSLGGMGTSLNQAWSTVGDTAMAGIRETGHFMKGAYDQALHLVPGEKEVQPQRHVQPGVRRRVHATARA